MYVAESIKGIRCHDLQGFFLNNMEQIKMLTTKVIPLLDTKLAKDKIYSLFSATY